MITRFKDIFQYLSIFILFFIIMISCDTENGEISVESRPPDMHNSMIALDWAGTYQGVVPCADCEGIETKITLSEELSYQIERVYLGRSNQVFKNKGMFSWSDDGSRIQLHNLASDSPGAYQVGENRLFQLDMAGNKISGILADRYILTKVIDNLSGLQWELIELEGTKLALNSEALNRPVLQFQSDENRISGNGSCNRFNGKYDIKSDNRISFSEIASTKMACDQMAVENKFFEILERAEYYTLNHDTLSLNQIGSANRARFLLLDESL